MKSVKIAIVSKSDKIRDFFRLEALTLNFEIDTFEKTGPHTDFSPYDLAIIDVDTIHQTPLNPAKKQLTVSEGSRQADLLYPTDISSLQKLYYSLLKENDTNIKYQKENDSKIIFFNDIPNIINIKDKKYLLSDSEYNLLKLLCDHYPNIVPREKIDAIFSCMNSNISDVYICKLRKKLEEPLGQRLILTIRSKGYKIVINSEWR